MRRTAEWARRAHGLTVTTPNGQPAADVSFFDLLAHCRFVIFCFESLAAFLELVYIVVDILA